MCYYSTTQPAHRVRDAKEGEDLTLRSDGRGHMFPQGTTDDKIVCTRHNSEVHIAELQFSGNAPHSLIDELAHLTGKPVIGRFYERNRLSGYAVDVITIQGLDVHFTYFAAGTKFYIGPKRVDVADKLGVNDPSITLDHMPDPKEGEEQVPAEPKQGEPVKEPAAPVTA